MKNFLFATLVVSAIAVTGAIMVVAGDLHRTLEDSDQAILDADAAVMSAKQLADDTAPQAQAILAKINSAAEQAKLAAAEERGNWNKTAKETALTARALRTLIDRTDRQLNDVALPNLNTQIDQVASASQVSLEAIGHSADTLTMQLNDPHIMSIAAHLDESARDVSDSAANLEAATEDIRVKVHQMTKPASWAVRVGSAILDFGAKAAQIFTAGK